VPGTFVRRDVHIEVVQGRAGLIESGGTAFQRFMNKSDEFIKE
jgi:hypothetical protein